MICFLRLLTKKKKKQNKITKLHTCDDVSTVITSRPAARARARSCSTHYTPVWHNALLLLHGTRDTSLGVRFPDDWRNVLSYRVVSSQSLFISAAAADHVVRMSTYGHVPRHRPSSYPADGGENAVGPGRARFALTLVVARRTLVVV